MGPGQAATPTGKLPGQPVGMRRVGPMSRLSLSIPLLLCVACTTSQDSDPFADSTATTMPVSTTSASSGDSSGDVADGTGAGKLDVGGETGGIVELAEVFGHSGSVLYRMDPDTKAVEEVGTFTGCDGSVIDIALDENSEMFGSTFGELYSIDRLTGACTLIAKGDYPTSLSFVPAGTVDPNIEALVGFVDEEYIRIDKQTGAPTTLGTLADGLASSGDLVSVIGGGTWLTVTGPGCESGDCLIELDPADGTIIQNYGPLPYAEVFGLAFWAGRAYGFAREGVLFEIEFGATDVLTTEIPIPGAPAMLEFFGAGSTTSAPPAEG